MQNTMQQDQSEQKQQNQALRFIVVQFVVTLVVTAALLIVDYTIAYSALVGGLIAALANAWFALKVFRGSSTSGLNEAGLDQAGSNQTAETILATFYVGEIYKFLFTGAMFIMAFVLIKPISVVALLITYFLVHMTPAVVNVFSQDSSIKDKEK